MDLGTTKPDSPNIQTAPASPSGDRKVSYPSFCLRDKVMESLLEDHNVSVGDEGTDTIRWRCSGMSDQEYGKSLDFEVLELNGMRHEASSDRELDEMADSDRLA